MAALRDRPLYTRVFDEPELFRPASGATYIYGLFEERSEHIKAWSGAGSDLKTIKIVDQDRNFILTDDSTLGRISLRNPSDVARLFLSTRLYVDITGLSHHVWAPLVKIAIERKIHLSAVYVEPASYTYSPSPRQGEIFDLSERIEGIAPIPLFATLNQFDSEQVCFVPLLGFEGTRLAYMIEQVEPPGGRIVPIIGVPGFQLEYPFHTYMGNQRILEETQSWKNVRYARANCPFSVFYVLEDILQEHPYDQIKIAPIGTKPHALGAVLLCITNSRSLELVYDHPKRKLKRTAGALRLLIYSISDFLS